MIVDPITLSRPTRRVAEALALMKQYRICGVPITVGTAGSVGILTNRDLRFETRTDAPRSPR